MSAGRRVRAGALAFVALACLAGCETFSGLGGERIAAGAPAASGDWVDDPRAYAAEIAQRDPSSRAAERRGALQAMLRSPRAEEAVRLQLVFAAAVLDIDETYTAIDEIESALAQASTGFAEAVLTGLSVSMEQRQRAYRVAIEQENLLNVEAEERAEVERERDRLRRDRRRLQQELELAQDRVRALMSIEQQIQDSSN